MGIQLRFSISSRKNDSQTTMNLVETNNQVEYYTKEVIIESHASGFCLSLPTGSTLLETGDVIITPEYKLIAHIDNQPMVEIGYQGRRAPVKTLSEQWQQAGLDTILNNNLQETNSLFPEQTVYIQNDPLDFLESTSTKTIEQQHHCLIETPSVNKQLNWLPKNSHHFDTPQSISSPDLIHINTNQNVTKQGIFNYQNDTIPDTEKEKYDNLNTMAPLDNIDKIYQNNQALLSETDLNSCNKNRAEANERKGNTLIKKIKTITQF